MNPKNISEFFSKKKTAENTDSAKPNGEEKTFSFVWYYKIVIENKDLSGTTTYKSVTKPFRTKVKGHSFKEAKEKLEEFAMTKCNVQIWQEDEYNKSEAGKHSAEMDSVFKKMDEIFKEMDSLFKKF